MNFKYDQYKAHSLSSQNNKEHNIKEQRHRALAKAHWQGRSLALDLLLTGCSDDKETLVV